MADTEPVMPYGSMLAFGPPEDEETRRRRLGAQMQPVPDRTGPPPQPMPPPPVGEEAPPPMAAPTLQASAMPPPNTPPDAGYTPPPRPLTGIIGAPPAPPPVTAAPPRQKFATPMTDQYVAETSRLATQKPSKLQNILGGILGAVHSRIDVHPNRTRELQNLALLKGGADEERQAEVARSNDEIRGDTLASNTAYRKNLTDATERSRQDRRTTARMDERLRQRPYSGAPQENDERGTVDIEGESYGVLTPQALGEQKKVADKATWISVPPALQSAYGLPENAPATLIQAAMQQAQAKANQEDMQIFRKMLADQSDATRRYGIETAASTAKTVASIRNEGGSNGPVKPVEKGTNDFVYAQDLAYGRMTMAHFRSLMAYSRDTNKKEAIYAKARELNPEFNPASFEMGFTLAKNPKVQQQLAAMDNVEWGVEDLLKASDAASRSGVTAINLLINKGGIALGGKKYSDFRAAQIGFADELSGALGFGSSTDMSREMGFNMTNGNLSPENFKSAIETIVVPFIQRKRATLLKQMGPYGTADFNPAATPGKPGEGGGALVKMRGPDGTVKPVPADQVAHYEQLGAKRVQ